MLSREFYLVKQNIIFLDLFFCDCQIENLDIILKYCVLNSILLLFQKATNIIAVISLDLHIIPIKN